MMTMILVLTTVAIIYTTAMSINTISEMRADEETVVAIENYKKIYLTNN